MTQEFGQVYAGILVRDHWIAIFDGTAEDALSRGVSPRDVWLGMCAELGVPPERWHGRGIADPPTDR